ncbi:MAG: hypothetical protein Q9194_002158 [Teloschistes cf. exilis]
MAQSIREQHESTYREIVSKYKNDHDILATFNQNLAQRTLKIQTMSIKNDDCASMQTELIEVLEKILEKAGEWSFEFEKNFVRWSIEEVMNRQGADTDRLEEMIWGYHHTRFGHLPVYEVCDGEIVEILNFRYPLAENQDDLDG